MTKEEKRIYIEALIDGVKRDIVAKLDRLPDRWDGHELSRYIADCFQTANGGLLAPGRVRRNGQTNRLRSYHNDILTLDI